MYKETYKDFRKRVLANLIEAISDSGLSQREQILAGMDLRYLRRIKNGEKNITIKTIWKICHAFEFDPVEIFR